MQMTTHRLIVCKKSRNFTHHFSRLSKYKSKPVCVNCEPDEVPLVFRANTAHGMQVMEDWILNNEDSSSEDDTADHGRSRREAIPRLIELQCGHTVCSSCLQASHANPTVAPCKFCADMREIGIEDCEADFPPPSSKLTVLIEHLKLLPQYRYQRHEQASLKQETSQKDFEMQEKNVEKAVVFALFKASLDICEALLREAGISHSRIDGDTPNRTEVIATFMHDDSVHVLLASSRSAGLGLNLTRASTVMIHA